MFNRKPKQEKAHALDETIENLISEIAGMTAGDEAHIHAVESLKILMELRIADKAAQRSFTLDPNQLISAGSMLLGIGLILGFEKANVITTKGLSFVPKPRI